MRPVTPTVMQDFGVTMTTDTTLDITIQTLLSGSCQNLGKAMDVGIGSRCFHGYDGACVGIATVLDWSRHGDGLLVWTGPLRSLTQEEHALLAQGVARIGWEWRGGAYIPYDRRKIRVPVA